MGRVVRGRGAREAVVSRGTSGTRTAAQGSDMEARESITGRSATAAPFDYPHCIAWKVAHRSTSAIRQPVVAEVGKLLS
jgi:hypothetical protein